MPARADIALTLTRNPLAAAACIHALSAALWLALAAQPVGATLPAALWPWSEGLCAAAIGAALRLPRWWLPINLLFVPAAFALLTLQLPAEVYLAGFGVLVLLNAASACGRVPLFLSTRQAAAVLTTLLPRRAGCRVLDLGSGTGSLLANLARVRPEGCYTGIELAPVPFLIGRLRARGNRALRMRWGDFWHQDLSGYDVVYAYLSPAPMARLWQKARAEMRAGSLFVSNDFAVPGVAPAAAIAVGDRMRSTLYVWRM
jgi:SAM-dependent methyltransferase